MNRLLRQHPAVQMLILLFISILIVSFLPRGAEAGTLENMLPEHSPANGKHELYESWPVDAYYFDEDYGLSGWYVKYVNMGISAIFQGLALAVKLGIYLHQLFTEMPFYDDLSNLFAKFADKLSDKVFSALLQVVYVFLSLWTLLKMFSRNRAQTAKDIGYFLIVLALAGWMINHIGTVYDKAYEWVDAVKQEVAEAGSDADGEEETDQKASVIIGNQVWRNLVITFWQFGEFGDAMSKNAKLSPDSKDQIANNTVGILSSSDERREEIVEDWAAGENPRYEMMSSDKAFLGRVVVVFLAVPTILMFLILFVSLSAGSTFYLIAFLLLGAALPFVALLALFTGGRGKWVVVNWVKAMGGAAGYAVWVTFLLTLYLLASTDLFGLSEEYGFLIGGIVPQLILIFLAWKFRKKLLDLLKAPMRQTQNFVEKLKEENPQRVQDKQNEAEQRAHGGYRGQEDGYQQHAAGGKGTSRKYLQDVLSNNAANVVDKGAQKLTNRLFPDDNNTSETQDTPDLFVFSGGKVKTPTGLRGRNGIISNGHFYEMTDNSKLNLFPKGVRSLQKPNLDRVKKGASLVLAAKSGGTSKVLQKGGKLVARRVVSHGVKRMVR